MVGSLAEKGEIERVLPRYARRSAPVQIVWPSRRFEPAAVALFREALAEALLRLLGGTGRAAGYRTARTEPMRDIHSRHAPEFG